MKNEKVWICRTCGKVFNSERGIVQHLVRKQEILIATRKAIEKKKALRRRILKEMMLDPHEAKERGKE